MANQQAQSMVSETSICNQALSGLGMKRIASLDVPSQSAEFCKDNYPFLRDEVLERRMWSFATVRATSTSEELAEFGELYVHPRPLGWLNVFRVYRAGTDQQDKSFRLESNGILSCYSDIDVWGVERVTDTGRFSNLFIQCLVQRLRAEMAIPLTKNRKMEMTAMARFEELLSEAAARDGQQGANEQIRSSSLIDARRGR